MIPQTSPVSRFASGGKTMESSSIPMLLQFLFYVMGEEAIVPITTFFMEKLQALVDQIGKEIRIAHYPPYTSKYNPIEHRLFPHVTRACKGLIFESINIVREAISKTKTKTGL